MCRITTFLTIIFAMMVLFLSCQDKDAVVLTLGSPAATTLAADNSLDQSAIIGKILDGGYDGAIAIKRGDKAWEVKYLRRQTWDGVSKLEPLVLYHFSNDDERRSALADMPGLSSYLDQKVNTSIKSKSDEANTLLADGSWSAWVDHYRIRCDMFMSAGTSSHPSGVPFFKLHALDHWWNQGSGHAWDHVYCDDSEDPYPVTIMTYLAVDCGPPAVDMCNSVWLSVNGQDWELMAEDWATYVLYQCLC